MRHLRVVLLFILSIIAVCLWMPRPLVAWLPWPVSCNGAPPVWLDELIQESKTLRLPGFQLSFRESNAKRVDCAVGWAQLWPWPQPLKTEHTLRYASLSKVMTSAVIMRLFENGQLHPENLLVDELDFATSIKDERIKKIKIKDLLSHKAGFDRRLSPDPMLSEHPWCPDNIERLASIKLDHNPGEVYSYSNLGYCLLGEIIKRHAKKPLEEVFQHDLIFPAKAKMITLKKGEVIHNEPLPIFDNNESQEDLLNIKFDAMQATGSWAGRSRDFLDVLDLITSPSSNFLSLSGRHALLSTAPECEISQWRTCHGYAFYRYLEKGGKTMYWRDGSLPGATSFAAFLDNGTAIVFLTHTRHYSWRELNDRLGLALYRALG